MNTRYICEQCGAKVEENDVIVKASGGTWWMICPICKGKLISEEEMKQKEEMQRNIEEDDDKDDDITPKQDAYEIDDILKHDLVEQMKENIKREGNDRVWILIENNIGNACQRARMRMFFLLAGGTCPQGEPINV